MAQDFDRQDERGGPLDIFIIALYRVDKVGGRIENGRQFCWHKIGTSSVCSTHEARQRPTVFPVNQHTVFHTQITALKMDTTFFLNDVPTDN